MLCRVTLFPYGFVVSPGCVLLLLALVRLVRVLAGCSGSLTR